MSSGGDSTTTQKSEPWSAQKPYLQDVFAEAQRLYRAPGPGYFSNPTVAPISPERDLALRAQAARAMQGSPLTAYGGQELGRILGGGYLNANPYLQGAIDAASQGAARNYLSAIVPGIDSSYSLAGRYGSGAHQSAHENAQRALAGQLGGIASNLAYQDYGAERANMMAALGMAPQFAMQDYADIGQLDAVGRAREAMAQALLDDQIARWNFAQQQPLDKLQQYAGLVQGNYGGTITTTTPSSGGGIGAVTDLFGAIGGLLGMF
ncbi:MAG: hypothetical protein ACREEE_12775 [Dongiaceae bacterium]